MSQLKMGLVFYDSEGRAHDEPQDAAIASLSKLMGKEGDNGVALSPIARTLFAARSEIEALFADFDQAEAQRKFWESNQSKPQPATGNNQMEA
jgi:hypothetical protein